MPMTMTKSLQQRGQLGKKDGETTLLEAGKQWLQQTLTSHGLGAKTALGYGFFQAS
jgi:CRISPR/Cas system CMR subunit Cmr6 (Cas7 group RAMP superfamily)